MKRIVLLLAIVLVALPFGADAQCSMCKAVVESDLEGGGTTAAGLNSGILYLMMFPYLLIGTMAFFYSRYKKRLSAQEVED